MAKLTTTNVRQLGSLALVVTLIPFHLTAQSPSPKSAALKPDEYSLAALIFNDELSALGDRALFPICVEETSRAQEKKLLKYLLANGYPVSDPFVCESRQPHPKDYPHGMRIYLGDAKREPDGTVKIAVDVGDLTLRPGKHFATLLRAGTYDFKLDDKGQWQIVGYTKKYDFADVGHENDSRAPCLTEPTQ